jgi:chromosome segregation ATPase
VCRQLQADNATLTTDKQDLVAQLELLKGQMAEASGRVQAAERAVTQARADLDRKRQKKRQYKASAAKFQQLWHTVRTSSLLIMLPCNLTIVLLHVSRHRADVC